MAKLALYTLRYIDKPREYKNDLFKNAPDFDMTKFWANLRPMDNRRKIKFVQS